MISARLRGRVVLAGAGISVAIIALVGLAGPSAAEPYVGRPGFLPPLFRPLHLPDLLVTGALWMAILLGTTAVLVGLTAIRDGWRPSLKRLLVFAAIAGAALTLTPPTGSTDLMDYATYGRAAAIGQSPYKVTPNWVRGRGDPVAKLSSHSWRKYSSVYGPLGTAEEWAASELAGTSAARTVFDLKVVNALAFLAIALTLDR